MKFEDDDMECLKENRPRLIWGLVNHAGGGRSPGNLLSVNEEATRQGAHGPHSTVACSTQPDLQSRERVIQHGRADTANLPEGLDWTIPARRRGKYSRTSKDFAGSRLASKPHPIRHAIQSPVSSGATPRPRKRKRDTCSTLWDLSQT